MMFVHKFSWSHRFKYWVIRFNYIASGELMYRYNVIAMAHMILIIYTVQFRVHYNNLNECFSLVIYKHVFQMIILSCQRIYLWKMSNWCIRLILIICRNMLKIYLDMILIWLISVPNEEVSVIMSGNLVL